MNIMFIISLYSPFYEMATKTTWEPENSEGTTFQYFFQHSPSI